MWVNEGEEGVHVHVWVNNEGPGRREEGEYAGE